MNIPAFDTAYPPPQITKLLAVATWAEAFNDPPYDTSAHNLAALGKLACEATKAYFGIPDEIPPAPPPPTAR